MTKLEQMVKELPPEFHQEVEDFIASLLQERATRKPRPKGQFKLDWRGALADMRDEYTSVELQHKISDWWDEDVSR